MLKNQIYYHLWFEKFHLTESSGHKSSTQLRVCSNQKIPLEIESECNIRFTRPCNLVTQFNIELTSGKHPIGTMYLLKAKLNDRNGGGLFFSSHYKWAPLDIVLPT